MSEKSKRKLALEVEGIRAVLTAGMPLPITVQQQLSQGDRKGAGPCWVSRVTFPAPHENSLCELVRGAIEELGEGGEEYTMPALEPVHAQWTGFRANVSAKEPEPSISETDKYKCMMKEVTSPVTILYMYGGGHTYAFLPANYIMITY